MRAAASKMRVALVLLVAFTLLGHVAQGARKSAREDDDDFNEFDNFDEESGNKAAKAPASVKSQETLKQGKKEQVPSDDFAGFDEDVSEVEEEEVPLARPAKEQAKPAAQEQKQQANKPKKTPMFQQAANQDDLDAEEFEHFVDDEEFETFDSSEVKESDDSKPSAKKPASGQKASAAKEQKNAMPSLKIADVPKHLMTNGNWQNYIYEIVMLVLIVAYFVNYLIGKSKNQRLATAWYSSHKELLERQFALVGDNGTSTELPVGSTATAQAAGEDGEEKRDLGSDQLIKESDNLYGLWCSGRQACDGMLVQMKFIKRQDLINGVLMQFIKPQSDQIVFSVEYPSHEDIDSFVFCLTTKKQSSQLHNNYQDLATYCIEKKAVNSSGGGDSIPSKYVVLNECSEVPSLVIDSRVSAFLRSYPDMVEYLHISDQYIGYKTQNADEQGNSATASADDSSSQVSGLPKSRCMLILCLNVNGKGFNTSVEDMENMQPALQLITYLIDKVPRIRVSKDAKTKALKKRKEVSEQLLKLTHKQRQEEAMLRKEEKRRAEKEKIMNESDPEKQKRLEEKDQKREKKKNMSKMKQIKIKSM